jgi:hypothetical protein
LIARPRPRYCGEAACRVNVRGGAAPSPRDTRWEAGLRSRRPPKARPPSKRWSSRLGSACRPCTIAASKAKAIWPLLVDEHAFAGSYSSVKRFLRRLAPPSVRATLRWRATRATRPSGLRLRRLVPGPEAWPSPPGSQCPVETRPVLRFRHGRVVLIGAGDRAGIHRRPASQRCQRLGLPLPALSPSSSAESRRSRMVRERWPGAW